MRSATVKIDHLIQNIEMVVKGKTPQIKLILTALLARGHVLLEDNPGTGKTIMAKTLAHSISNPKAKDGGIEYKRIQFTPDLLPMDLIGTHVYDEVNKEFIFKKGPLFTNVLLADEINRASPKVQSALLECMAENQITIGEQTYPLQDLFFTIATQNPIEMEGTYPLPAAQLDRFFLKVYFGYVDEETELDIYKQYRTIDKNLIDTHAVLNISDILHLQETVDNVYLHDELLSSVRNIVRATRLHPEIVLGASTRSGITFVKCLKAYALLNDRDYAIEDDIVQLAHSVLDHRLMYKTRDAKINALRRIVDNEMDRLHKLKIHG